MSKFDLAKMLKDAADDADGRTRFRPDYSGRGMCGRTCVGVVGSFGACMETIGAVIKDLKQEVFDAAIGDLPTHPEEAYKLNEEASKAIDQLLDVQWDSMGFDVVVYFEQIRVTEDEDGDSDN